MKKYSVKLMADEKVTHSQRADKSILRQTSHKQGRKQAVCELGSSRGEVLLVDGISCKTVRCELRKKRKDSDLLRLNQGRMRLRRKVLFICWEKGRRYVWTRRRLFGPQVKKVEETGRTRSGIWLECFGSVSSLSNGRRMIVPVGLDPKS